MSETSEVDSFVPVTRNFSDIICAICRLRRNRLAFWAFCFSAKTLLEIQVCQDLLQSCRDLGVQHLEVEVLIPRNRVKRSQVVSVHDIASEG